MQTHLGNKVIPLSSFVVFPSLSFDELKCEYYESNKKRKILKWVPKHERRLWAPRYISKWTTKVIQMFGALEKKEKNKKNPHRQVLHSDKTPIRLLSLAFPQEQGGCQVFCQFIPLTNDILRRVFNFRENHFTGLTNPSDITGTIALFLTHK